MFISRGWLQKRQPTLGNEHSKCLKGLDMDWDGMNDMCGIRTQSFSGLIHDRFFPGVGRKERGQPWALLRSRFAAVWSLDVFSLMFWHKLSYFSRFERKLCF